MPSTPKNSHVVEMRDVGEHGVIDWREVFGRFDMDGDGVVPLLEMRRYLADSQRRRHVPQHVIDQLLTRADADMDGNISYREFIDLVSGAQLNAAGTTLTRRLVLAAAFSVVPRSQRARRYIDQYRCCPPPLFVPLVSVVQLVLFIMDGVRLGGVTASGPVDTESILIYSPYRRVECWRLATYMFVHVGFVHISTNLLVQLVVGVPLEMVHRWWRVALIYMTGVVAGSLATSLFDSHVFLAGASGGVYAILAAHLSDLLVNWSEMEVPLLRLLLMSTLALSDVGVAIYNRYMSSTPSKVGYVAHMAGAVAGVLVANVVLRNLRVRRWERVLWWLSLAALAALAAVAAAVNVALPAHFPPQEI